MNRIIKKVIRDVRKLKVNQYVFDSAVALDNAIKVHLKMCKYGKL